MHEIDFNDLYCIMAGLTSCRCYLMKIFNIAGSIFNIACTNYLYYILLLLTILSTLRFVTRGLADV